MKFTGLLMHKYAKLSTFTKHVDINKAKQFLFQICIMPKFTPSNNTNLFYLKRIAFSVFTFVVQKKNGIHCTGV